MILISVVTGTYNRLEHLKKMVESIRFSIGARVYGSFIASGIEYEIVVVDGGSTDETIDWCKSQPDIKLIEHGKLLGAVKAFNDGAYASRGDYVILANDDVVFINESILSAISFMQNNKDIGIGCFYQDRYGQSWHVEQMPAVLNGKQISANYGQVCIVPKELGDKVGWWGDYLRTYGGDNELSCHVLELGYKIEPIPCACIHDSIPNDDLRSKNNDQQIVNGKHPDSEAFVKKWTHPDKKNGPIIDRRKGEWSYDLPTYFRCLYLPIYEPGNMLQKTTKHGLRDALSKKCLVVEVDYVQDGIDYAIDVSKAFKPHFILTQIQSVDAKVNANKINEFRIENPNAIFINWNGDYHPEHLFSRSYIELMKAYHFTGFCTTDVKDIYDEKSIRWGYWQIGYEETNVTESDYPECDIALLANGYSDKRKELAEELLKSGLSTHFYGIGWPEHIQTRGDTLYDFEKGAKIYKRALMTISDAQWPHAGGYVSNRLFQAMDAGVLVLQQRFDKMEELLGLKDGVHLVVWDNFEDLIRKVKFLKDNKDEIDRIAKEGQRFVHNYHSFDYRVSELFKMLGWE